MIEFLTFFQGFLFTNFKYLFVDVSDSQEVNILGKNYLNKLTIYLCR